MNLDQARARAEIFKALGHPIRLLVVVALRDGEQTVTQLHGRLGVSLPTLSRHVAQLKRAGIVTEYRAGPSVMHRLSVSTVIQALPPVERVVAHRSSRQARSL